MRGKQKNEVEQIKINIDDENSDTKTIELDEEKVILENENDKIQDDYTDTESDNDSYLESEIDDNYSDNFSDEEEICNGLENNLQEINFIESESEELIEDNSKVVEEVRDLGNTFNSDAEEESFEETTNLNSNTSHEINNEYQNKNINELIEEINKLKKIAFEKDEEVKELKNKYKNLYSELNL